MNSTEKFYNNLMIFIDRELESESDSVLGNSKEQILTKKMSDDLCSGNSPAIRCVDRINRYENTSSSYKINGYGIDDTEHLITVVSTIYISDNSPQRVYKTNIDSALDKLRKFIENAVKEPNKILDIIHEDNDYYELVYYLANEFTSLYNFSFVILTNGIVGEITFPTIKISGKKVDITLFDIERYRRFTEGQKVVSIVANLDILGKSIPCTRVTSDYYDTYCCILSGNVIYNLFDAYHYQLLNSNVRTYLQLRGSVNKGIMDTIQNNPNYFLAYNNGISATASEVVLNDDQEIVEMKDFQIVNGGQTSASIYNAKINKGFDISKLNVLAKITVVGSGVNYGEMVKNISKYANTQNAIKFSDFSSTDKYNTKLAEFSRTTYTPALGSKLQSKWYYENVSGSYNNEKSDSASPASFEKEYPSSQRFQKTDMAAYELAYQGHAAIACKGAQDAYKVFVMNLPTLALPTEETFKNLVAKKILFDTVKNLISERVGGQGITAMAKYVVAYFATIICKNRFALMNLWNEQKISSEFIISDLETLIDQLCPVLSENARNKKKSVEMYCRTPSTWEAIKQLKFSVDYSDVYANGVEINPSLSVKLLPQAVASFIISMSDDVWTTIADNVNIMATDDKSRKYYYSFCKTMKTTSGDMLSEKQLACAAKIIIRAKECDVDLGGEIREKMNALETQLEDVKKRRTVNYSTSKYFIKATL